MGLVAEKKGYPSDDFHKLEELRWKSHEAAARILALSEREREILRELARAWANKHIARALSISPRTVEIHRANIMRKLGARHLVDALRLVFLATLFDD